MRIAISKCAASVTALLVTMFNLHADTATIDGIEWTYTVSNDEVSIGGGSSSRAIATSTTGDITIPSMIDGKPVVNVAPYAFIECRDLVSVTIPNSITNIGPNAFYGCSGLTGALTIPDGVTNIGGGAFNGCSGLSSVTIGNGVTSIGYSAFNGCSGLTGALTIPDGVTSIEQYAFSGCSGLTDVTIPDSVTNIESFAFNCCSGLMGVTIPNSITSIEDFAFNGCSGLTSVTIPDSVTSIEVYAFGSCTSLAGVTIGDGVTSIDNYAFYNCSGLTSVTIPDSVTSIGGGVFSGCSRLTSVTIPDGVTSIGRDAFSGCSDYLYDTSSILGVRLVDGWVVDCLVAPCGNLDLTGVRGIGYRAFSGCSGLTSVTIPDSVTSIGEGAFSGCSRLTSVTIPDGVTSIGRDAFSGCSGLTSVTIGNGVTSIECYYAFMGCNNIRSVVVPGWTYGIPFDNVTNLVISVGTTSIGDSAFYGCSGLTSVTIPDGVTSIGSYAFYGCSGLTSVTIPDGVTNIGEWAFSGCSGLTSVTIPDSVTSIGECAFYGCSGLTSVTIPDGVTSIGECAFYGCSGLTSVTIPDSVTSIEVYAFGSCTSLAGVTIGDGVTSIDNYAFYNCSGLTSVMIPDSVTSIGEGVFSGCSGLTSVTIPDGVTSIGDSAFRGCIGLVSMTFNGAKPSQTGSLIFDWIPEGLCIYVMDSTGWRDENGKRLMTWCDRPVVYVNDKDFRLTIKPNFSKYGTVSGGGTFMSGTDVEIKATANKGNVFVGWFADKACTKPLNPKGYDNRNPSVAIEMPAKDTTVYAKFITAAADKTALKFSSATKKLAKTPTKATAGAAFSLKLGISSASLPTVTATGLPDGLSIDKTTGEITGKATKPGSYTATVTVKDAAGNKITQKVKITVSVQSWAKGTFYGVAMPGKKTSDPAAYLTFTVGSTGKVSGKVKYKGKAYSFTSSYSSCTAAKATFAPKVKIGSSTFQPKTVTVKKTVLDGLSVVEAANAKGTFAAQKKPGLVKKGKTLAALVGWKRTFTKKDGDSGLTKNKDKLKVEVSNGDAVKVSGTVNGKKLSAVSLPLLVADKATEGGVTTYTLYADIIEPTLKYVRTLVFFVDVDDTGAVAEVVPAFL